MANNLHRRVSFGLFEFAPATGDLRREGVAVKLAPQPARVLALLLSRPGEVILREEFRRELWGDDTFVDFERSLNFCITQARAALGDSSENPRFIQTVPRRGYRFIAPVAFQGLSPTLEDAPIPKAPIPNALITAEDVPRSNVPAAQGWRSRSILVAVMVTIVAVGWWGWNKRPSSAAADLPPSTRVAVMPFTNLTGDVQFDVLADGLTDATISELGALSRDRLSVIARTSVMTYRKTAKTVAEIGHELDVQYVVEGSLRRDGESLRISANFIPVALQTATSSWSDLFHGSTLALDAHQTPAAIRLARQIASVVLPDTDAIAEPARAVDADAWEDFLRASAAMHRGTTADIRGAIRDLQHAVERDAGFGPAWARLAEARHLLVMMGVDAPKDAYPEAERAAQRALEVTPTLPAAHLAQGLVHLWYNWRPADAAVAFERAIALNPSLAAAHHDYAWALVALGKTQDAVRHITRARDLDPLSTRANNDIGWLHLFVRQPEAAARACQHTLAIDADALEAQACLERAYTLQDRFDAALHAARTTLPRSDAAPATTMQGAEGLRAVWAWRLQQLERAAAMRWINPYTRAVHHVLLNNPDQALAALDEAYTSRVGMMVFLAQDPAMDPLRGDPRFAALVKKVTQTAF